MTENTASDSIKRAIGLQTAGARLNTSTDEIDQHVQEV